MSIKLVIKCVGEKCGSYHKCCTKDNYWVGCELRTNEDFVIKDTKSNKPFQPTDDGVGYE